MILVFSLTSQKKPSMGRKRSHSKTWFPCESCSYRWGALTAPTAASLGGNGKRREWSCITTWTLKEQRSVASSTDEFSEYTVPYYPWKFSGGLSGLTTTSTSSGFLAPAGGRTSHSTTVGLLLYGPSWNSIIWSSRSVRQPWTVVIGQYRSEGTSPAIL
jgi:hypothetical protein